MAGRFYRLGLSGYPLAHSRSPELHQAALEACGLQGEYRLYPCPPEDEPCLRGLLEALRRGALDGLNLTIPHKTRLLPWLDALTPAARAIGAVNTLFVQAGRLWGENTDAPAFWEDLQAHNLTAGRRALLLGAGGAARAVAWALKSHGWQVWVMARRPEAARLLQSDFALAGSLPWLADAPRVDLLVNCTPLGMWPRVEASPWPPERPLPAAAVYDLVYNPEQTRLLAQAAAQGLAAVGGMGMLVRQAHLAFVRWTGCRPEKEG